MSVRRFHRESHQAGTTTPLRIPALWRWAYGGTWLSGPPAAALRAFLRTAETQCELIDAYLNPPVDR